MNSIFVLKNRLYGHAAHLLAAVSAKLQINAAMNAFLLFFLLPSSTVSKSRLPLNDGMIPGGQRAFD
jgi:hypothetical protein